MDTTVAAVVLPSLDYRCSNLLATRVSSKSKLRADQYRKCQDLYMKKYEKLNLELGNKSG